MESFKKYLQSTFSSSGRVRVTLSSVLSLPSWAGSSLKLPARWVWLGACLVYSSVLVCTPSPCVFMMFNVFILMITVKMMNYFRFR